MKVLKRCLCLTFVVLLVAPGLVSLLDLVPYGKLRGVRPARADVPLSLASVLSGDYQRAFEAWFKEQLHVWGYLVRTDNQLNYTLFRQVSSGYRASVVAGKDDFLIHREYLRSFSRVRVPSDDRVAKIVGQLKELQERLSERQVHLVVLVSPSKTALYPEYVRPEYIAPMRQRQKPSSYEKFLPLMRSEGVNHFDAFEFLTGIKAQSRFPLFTHSGSHWSDYASCLVTQELLGRVGTLLGKPMGTLVCEEGGVRSIPLDFDRDLTAIVNLWYPEQTYRPTQSVRHAVEFPQHAVRPRVAIIGTSFLWSILRYLDAHRLFETRDFYFYFRNLYDKPGPRGTPVQRNAIDWERDLFDKDLILLEVNEAWIERVGYGFVPAALKQLRKSEADHRGILAASSERRLSLAIQGSTIEQ